MIPSQASVLSFQALWDNANTGQQCAAFPLISFDTAIRDSARQRIPGLGIIPVLVGIPCYNNQSTVGQVVETVGRGLKESYPDSRSLIFVSDGGSTDDSREAAEAASLPDGVERLVAIYRGTAGKGSSLRAVLEMAEMTKSKAIIMFDADLENLRPDWVQLLAGPILDGKFDFVVPHYLRHKNDATITKLLAAPLVRSIFGWSIQQPIGGEFGLSLDMAHLLIHQNVWNSDVARFGIDIWMTVNALQSDLPVGTACLGAKIHGKKDPRDLGPMFRQVTGTLFTLLSDSRDDWRRPVKPQPIPFVNDMETCADEPTSVPVDTSTLVEDFALGFVHFSDLWADILDPENFRYVEELFLNKNGLKFDPKLWARIIYDFLIQFSLWRKDRIKLISMMTPLYYARAASLLDRTKTMSTQEAEAWAEEQAKAFVEEKPYLVKKAARLLEKAGDDRP